MCVTWLVSHKTSLAGKETEIDPGLQRVSPHSHCMAELGFSP